MSKFISVSTLILSLVMIALGFLTPKVEFLSFLDGISSYLYVAGFVLLIIYCIATGKFRNVLNSFLFDIVAGIALLFVALFVLGII